MRRTGALCLAAVLSLPGCSLAGGRPAVQEAVEQFSAAVSAGDGARACALLAPLTRRELEDAAGTPCGQAVLDLGLAEVDRTTDVRRYGHEGVVRLESPDGERDTRFVALFDGVWLVTAAGCTPRGDLPHDCDLEGP